MLNVNLISMSDIRLDFKDYFDLNGFPAPSPLTPGTINGSDNGPMFLAEYMVMLKKSNLLTDQDKQDFASRITACIGSNMLNRVPVGQNDGLEGPDDYLGILNACRELGNTTIPRTLLWGMIRYLGFMNNPAPGTFTEASFLARQPQIIAAMVNAAFPSMWNPLHYLIRHWAFFFYFCAAVSIYVSCINDPTSDTDGRRLSWHLQNNMKKNSLMCWIASHFWMKRLAKDYPGMLMNGVASLYYHPQPDNPYAKYWIT
jgi:hypothetical protein